jgi:uncharacterized protein (UPF0210 family)
MKLCPRIVAITLHLKTSQHIHCKFVEVFSRFIGCRNDTAEELGECIRNLSKLYGMENFSRATAVNPIGIFAIPKIVKCIE